MSTRLAGAGYKRIFDQGRSVKGRLMVAWYLESPGSGTKAGVVVSKKSFHRAVDRNRAKRLMREAYRLLASEGAAPERTEWVFVGRAALGGKTCNDVLREMKWMAANMNARPESPKGRQHPGRQGRTGGDAASSASAVRECAVPRNPPVTPSVQADNAVPQP